MKKWVVGLLLWIAVVALLSTGLAGVPICGVCSSSCGGYPYWFGYHTDDACAGCNACGSLDHWCEWYCDVYCSTLPPPCTDYCDLTVWETNRCTPCCD